YKDHRTSSNTSNNNETDDNNDNNDNNITCDENLNIGSKNIKNLHFNFPTSVKSWVSSYSRSQKYSGTNLGNRIEVYAPSRRLSEDSNINSIESDTGGTVTIETERTPLIHRTSVMEDASNYKSLMDLGKSTLNQTTFNAVNVLMGIGILALPFAFKHTGWIIGISIFLFCLISTNYTAKILKNCLDVDRTCHSYVDLAYLAYGNKGKYFIGTIFLMDLYNASDSLKTLFPQSDLIQLKFIVFFIITPITWLPIRYLSYTSIFGVIATAALTLVLLIDGFTKLNSPGSLIQPMDTYLWPQKWISVPLAFGIINAGFSGHAIFPSLYRDMAKPNDYRKM
ncbi:4386_t:CDS:2, partial [Dentiscutata erythropus]